MSVQLDRFTIVLLILLTRPSSTNKRAHLADLHEAGCVIAGGPRFDERFRG